MYSIYTNRWGKRLVMLGSLKKAFLAMQEDLANSGVDIEMTDAWRGQAEQEADYAGGVSKAHWTDSPHNYGVAFDVAPVVNGKVNYNVDNTTWNLIAIAGKDQNLVWGGDFSTILDKPHFEVEGWRDDPSLVLLPTDPLEGKA